MSSPTLRVTTSPSHFGVFFEREICPTYVQLFVCLRCIVMSLEPCCGGQKAALLRSATLDDIDDDVDDKRVASTADDGRRQKRQRLELV
jgi:hypothetical protein